MEAIDLSRDISFFIWMRYALVSLEGVFIREEKPARDVLRRIIQMCVDVADIHAIVSVEGGLRTSLEQTSKRR